MDSSHPTYYLHKVTQGKAPTTTHPHNTLTRTHTHTHTHACTHTCTHTDTHTQGHLHTYHCYSKAPHVCTNCVALSWSCGIDALGLQQGGREGGRCSLSPPASGTTPCAPPTHSHTLCPTSLMATPMPRPLTAMYGRQPISFVFAMESMSCPVKPKSQSLMAPLRFITTLDGLMSAGRGGKGKGWKEWGGEGQQGLLHMHTHTQRLGTGVCVPVCAGVHLGA